MSINQYALAQMTLASLFLGVFLELSFEIFRFAGGVFWPYLLRDEYEKKDNVAVIAWITVRDFVFLLFCGIVFCIFVYYTNDGRVRFIAILGTLIGFCSCYFTIGRVIRNVSSFVLDLLYKALSVLFYPYKLLAKCLVCVAVRLRSNVNIVFRRNFTLKEINKLNIIKHNGIP